MLPIHGALALCLTALALASVPAGAAAQAYPSRPLRLMIGAAPGASGDAITRTIGDRFAKVFNQSVVVENRAGASGNIAAEAIARAAPDGHTLLVTLDWHVSNAGVIAKMPFDPISDFEAIGMIGTLPYLFAVGPTVPARSFAELVNLARGKPVPLSIGLFGPGSPPHLMIGQIKRRLNLNINEIQYKSGAPALNDVVAGHVDLVIGSPSLLGGMISSNRIRVLAATTGTRLEQYPDVPTLAESGLPGFDAGTWYALLTTGKTPAPIVARLNQELNALINDPESRARLRQAGIVPRTSTPQDTRAFMQSELTRLVGELKAAGITPQ